MKVVNLTPHELTVYQDGQVMIRIPASGTVARVKSRATFVGNVQLDDIYGGWTIPIVKTEYGEIENLPDPQPGTVNIVSILVAQVLQGKRDDVVAPDTGPESVVRDSEGKILGVRRFTR